ncbi:MFS polyamine transporter [Pyrrhoderma noxium]|uniref:MFS polyamine transporter n=1 Tax=Pyrrhoderma noxium TaxID=2282107 RepID=A0A286UB20_9AGAM|nr:MFS polyamine transporter [Pyrrhoderma noxium]
MPTAIPYRLLSQHPKDDSDSDSEHGVDSPVLDPRTHEEIQREIDAHVGVARVEAAEKVYGKYSKWVLFSSLALACYIYSLDGCTTSSYLTFAASALNDHSLISSVQVAQSIIIAVGKPVIAKVADVSSRAFAYLGVLIFYVVGYIVIASAQTIGTVAGGIVIYAVGYTGLQLLTQIIIADLTTLRWRSLVSSLTSLPFVINGFVGPNIATQVLAHAGWRWGYGMFAILVPATLLPLILTLFWAENKAKKIGLVEQQLAADGVHIDLVSTKKATWPQWIYRTAGQLDVIGLLLLGASVALILLPLTLANSASNGWKNPSMIAMIVVGFVILVMFAVWDPLFASRPVIAPRLLRNRSVVLASWIGFFDFFSYYLTYVYLYSFVLVVKPWSTLDATYFMQTQTIALTVFGITAGGLMYYVRYYKPWLIFGLIIRLVGCGLMLHSRGANGSTVEIVWTQILQGLGGGFAAVAMQVGAQASVPHSDVAIVTAVVLLLTEIGGAVGSAVAGAIWSNTMPNNLEKYLPQVNETLRAELYSSITDVLAYDRDDPIRIGVIQAYDDSMKDMVIAGLVTSAVPIILSLFMPNWYLSDKQNAVDDSALDHDDEGEQSA